jgi:alanyl-tRNA synthetase
MQFVKKEDGSFEELPKKNIDFGGGLERITMATVGPDIFFLDIFNAARSILETAAGKSYGSDDVSARSMRIILDHMRASAFILSEGVAPSNTEAGYILRRLIRRSIRHADLIGVESLSDVATSFGKVYEDVYPQLVQKESLIREEIQKEEAKFRRTLKTGMREFEKLAKKGSLSGHDAFVLFSSYGFPIEITEELALERGITVDHDAFRQEMGAHQAKSRTASEGRFKGGLADHSDITVRYHTSHHLLLAALRNLLGDSVHQRGSNITQERVRLDFSFDRKLTPEELRAAEDLVNQKIGEALPVFATPMPKDEATKLGAEQEFGVKYGDIVTVYSMGPKNATQEDPRFKESFSLEFCGGPHVVNTRELGDGAKRFRIIKEESVAAGIRRIKAVLE